MRFILSGGYVMGGGENYLYRAKKNFMKVGEKFVLVMRYCTCTRVERSGDATNYFFHFKIGREIATKKWIDHFKARAAKRRQQKGAPRDHRRGRVSRGAGR